MATQTVGVNPRIDGGVSVFRTEAKKISDAIKAVGLVLTSDTGQIDFNTVAAPTAGSYTGYEIFAFTGAAQTARPFFMKVEYGCGSGNSTHLGIRVTVGSSTNGAGTLTGVASPPLAMVSPASQASVPSGNQDCLFSSDGSTYFWMLLFPDYFSSGTTWARTGFIFILDRARNTDGSASPDGMMLLGARNTGVYSNSIEPFSQMLVTVTGMPNGALTLVPRTCCFLGTFSSTAFANLFFFYPHFFASPKVYSASPIVLGMFNTEITRGVVVPVQVYGQTKNFYSLGDRAGQMSMEGYNGNGSPTNAGTHGLALRWE